MLKELQSSLLGVLILISNVVVSKSPSDIIIIGADGGDKEQSPIILDSGNSQSGKKGATIIILPQQKSSYPPVMYRPPPYPYPPAHLVDPMYGSASHPSIIPVFRGYPLPVFDSVPPEMVDKPLHANSTKSKKRKKKQKTASVTDEKEKARKPMHPHPSMYQGNLHHHMFPMNPAMNMDMNMNLGQSEHIAGAHMSGDFGGIFDKEMSKMPQIVIKVPAPIVHIPQPIVNVPPAIVNVSAPILHIPPTHVTVPTPIIDVPAPMVNVDIPKISIPPAIVKVPKKLTLRKEVTVRGRQHGNEVASSGNSGEEDQSDRIYKGSSSNKDNDKMGSYQEDDNDDEYDDENRPAVRAPPPTPIPRPRKKYYPTQTPDFSHSPNQRPHIRANDHTRYGPRQVPSSVASYLSEVEHKHERNNYNPYHPPFPSPPKVKVQQDQGLIRLTVPVPGPEGGYHMYQPRRQSFSDDDSGGRLGWPENLPDYESYHSSSPPQFDDDTPTDKSSDTGLKMVDMIDGNLNSPWASPLIDPNMQVLMDEGQEPNIVFEKALPPPKPSHPMPTVSTLRNFLIEQGSEQQQQHVSSRRLAHDDPDGALDDEVSGKAFFRDSRDGMIFEEVTKRPTKGRTTTKQNSELMMYQDGTKVPVYADREEKASIYQFEDEQDQQDSTLQRTSDTAMSGGRREGTRFPQECKLKDK